MFKVSNLLKIYSINNKKKIILNNINFCLPNKGMFFIYGKSGCGKSTLLNILEGIGEVDGGEVLYDGVNIYNLSEKDREVLFKNYFGILFQSFNLFEYLTVSENLSLTMNIKGSNEEDYVEKLMKKYKIDHLKDHLVSSLSGGEKQRLCLVRALLNKPRVLFADEPTGALDKTNSFLMLNYLKELSKEMLIVIVTHNMELIRNYYDGNIYIKNGKIDINYKNINEKEVLKKENRKAKDYSSFFLRKKIKKNIKTNIFGSISIFFGTIFICLFLSFFIGFRSNFSNIQFTYLNYNLFNVSQIEYQESENEHVNIVRKKRPELSFIEDYFSGIENKLILNSYDHLIGNNSLLVNENNFKDFKVDFYYENSDLNYIYVNDMFLVENEGIANSIHKEVSFKTEKNVTLFNKEKKTFIEDLFELNETYILKGINKEFSYLNSKKLYLPYMHFTNMLKSKIPNNFNKDIEIKKSYFNIINESENTDEINGLSYIIYVDNIDDCNKMISLINSQDSKSRIRIEQKNYLLIKSFKEIIDIFLDGANIFLVIIILSNIFLISFLCFYSYISSIKENAILKVLGGSNKSIYKIYLLEQLIFGGFAALFGSFVVNITIKILNRATSSFLPVKTLFYNNSLMILGVLIISIIIILLSSLLPFLFSKKINIIKELKEE